jgi:predicted nucleic acid-binding protein
VPPTRRPGGAHNVYSFEGALVPPDQLVLETSFVVDALIPSQARHAECEGFLENIGRARSRVFVNRFLELELWEATYRIALREQRVPSLMRHGLTSYDAVHAATAEYADVRPFVTLDYHFAAVPEHDLQLWVPASRVRPFRERRTAPA